MAIFHCTVRDSRWPTTFKINASNIVVATGRASRAYRKMKKGSRLTELSLVIRQLNPNLPEEAEDETAVEEIL